MTFIELLQERGEFGDMHGKAEEVLEKYNSADGIDELEGEELIRYMERRSRVQESLKRIEDAMEVLGREANVISRGEQLAEGIFLALLKEHNTVAQGLVWAIVQALRLYSESSYDPRNREAVAVCELIDGLMKAKGINGLSCI